MLCLLFKNIHFSNLVKILVCDGPGKIWVFRHWGLRSKSFLYAAPAPLSACPSLNIPFPLPPSSFPVALAALASLASLLSLHILTSGLSSPRSTKVASLVLFHFNQIPFSQGGVTCSLFKITTGSHHTQHSPPSPLCFILVMDTGLYCTVYRIYLSVFKCRMQLWGGGYCREEGSRVIC